MSKTFIFVLAVIPAMLLAIVIPHFSKARQTLSATTCINRLRQMDAVKGAWALELNKTTNDTPTWADISPYIYWINFTNKWFTNGVPVCPGGGTYALGRVGTPPTCSLGDKDLRKGRLAAGRSQLRANPALEGDHNATSRFVVCG